MIERKCYFYNVGTTFDKNNLEILRDVWNCNPLCCKSDLCNGLYCEDYGIDFDKEYTLKHIKDYVKNGVNNTYGYIKEVTVSLSEDVWDEIYNSLVKDYTFESKEVAQKEGFIPFDYGEIIEDYSSYWEEPEISYFKDKNKIKKNNIHVLKESDLNQDTIKWINDNLYGNSKEQEIGEECEYRC